MSATKATTREHSLAIMILSILQRVKRESGERAQITGHGKIGYLEKTKDFNTNQVETKQLSLDDE